MCFGLSELFQHFSCFCRMQSPFHSFSTIFTIFAFRSQLKVSFKCAHVWDQTIVFRHCHSLCRRALFSSTDRRSSYILQVQAPRRMTCVDSGAVHHWRREGASQWHRWCGTLLLCHFLWMRMLRITCALRKSDFGDRRSFSHCRGDVVSHCSEWRYNVLRRKLSVAALLSAQPTKFKWKQLSFHNSWTSGRRHCVRTLKHVRASQPFPGKVSIHFSAYIAIWRWKRCDVMEYHKLAGRCDWSVGDGPIGTTA